MRTRETPQSTVQRSELLSQSVRAPPAAEANETCRRTRCFRRIAAVLTAFCSRFLHGQTASVSSFCASQPTCSSFQDNRRQFWQTCSPSHKQEYGGYAWPRVQVSGGITGLPGRTRLGTASPSRRHNHGQLDCANGPSTYRPQHYRRNTVSPLTELSANWSRGAPTPADNNRRRTRRRGEGTPAPGRRASITRS